jgi:hypothetical protein
MMAALPPDAAAKLSKICGLLGSDQDGERSAAAHQATRLLRSHGLTWADVIAPARPAAAPRRATYGPPHVAAAAAALRHVERLTAWEVTFLRDITRRNRFSPKQAAALTEIVQKLRAAGAA